MKVIFHKTIQINFKLPQAPIKKPSPKNKNAMRIQYNMVAKSKEENPKPKTTQTYPYTIIR